MPLQLSRRRGFLRSLGLTSLAGLFAPRLRAQSSGPTMAPWWPSRWGPDDEAGASNWITPAKVLESAKWIRDGHIYRLGRPYEKGMPLFSPRKVAMTIPGSPTGGPVGENRLIYHDEFVAAQIGQVGTQFDGLGH